MAQQKRTDSSGDAGHIPLSDIVGLVLALAALLTALALFGYGPGLISGSVAGALRLLFGWGAYLLVLGIGIAGIGLVQQHSRRLNLQKLPWAYIVALEFFFFSVLALAHLFVTTTALENIDSGLGGGIVGTMLGDAVASLLGLPGAIAVFVLFAAGALVALVDLSTSDVRIRAATLRLRAEQKSRELRHPPVPPAPSAPATRDVAEAKEEPADETEPAPKKSNTPSTRSDADEKHAQAAAAARRKKRRKKKKRGQLPPPDLLHAGKEGTVSDVVVRERQQLIIDTLEAFGVPAEIVNVSKGPTVTQYGVRPGFIEREKSDGTVDRKKVKVSKITSLADDLALALAAKSIRVEAPVPGKPYIGIEVPNGESNMVMLKGVLEDKAFKSIDSDLRIGLGRDVSGHPVATDLAKLPHLLIAGATGSGKSVAINAMIIALLLNLPPDELRLLLVDPKMVELIPYNGIPHLIAPVVTDVEEVVGALKWAMREMDRRYKLFSEKGTRNLAAYNAWADANDEERLPYIVIIIDELADLMMVAPEEVERIICRLAQMARATGIHLIIATQRPSVDVVTGLIKANFSARIAFAVASSVDSRVILDTVGAEALLGQGDMLYMAPDASQLQRLQGCYVSDAEINAVVNWWRLNTEMEPMREEDESIDETPWEDFVAEREMMEEDELLPDAIELLNEYESVSISFLQRKLRVGYNRAARLVDLLEDRGLIGEPDEDNHGRRPVISDKNDSEYDEYAADKSDGGSDDIEYDDSYAQQDPDDW